MKKQKLNVRLLRKIQRHITVEPRRYDQFAIVEESYIAPCGTVACLAGWANILTGAKPDSADARDLERAAKKLGINGYDPLALGGGHFLFDRMAWPKQFQDQHQKARTWKQRAKIACQRIDHLIATGV